MGFRVEIIRKENFFFCWGCKFLEVLVVILFSGGKLVYRKVNWEMEVVFDFSFWVFGYIYVWRFVLDIFIKIINCFLCLCWCRCGFCFMWYKLLLGLGFISFFRWFGGVGVFLGVVFLVWFVRFGDVFVCYDVFGVWVSVDRLSGYWRVFGSVCCGLNKVVVMVVMMIMVMRGMKVGVGFYVCYLYVKECF